MQQPLVVQVVKSNHLQDAGACIVKNRGRK